MEKTDVIPEVACDFCHKKIRLQDTRPEDTMVEGAAVKYWACPHCGHKYVIRIYTKEQIQLDEQYQCFAKELAHRRKKGKTINPARLRKLEALRGKAEAYQKMLKDKYLVKVTAILNPINTEADNNETNS